VNNHSDNHTNARTVESGSSTDLAKDTPSSVALPFFLALAVLFVMAYGAWKWYQVRQFELNRGQAIPADVVGPPLKEFELTERSGQPFRSLDMRGKVWVVTYFFTTCPGNCIRLNQNIQLMHNLPEIKDVTWVSVTCDPDTDTLEALRAYADRWKADPKRWLFCRADMETTQRIARGMDLGLYRKGHQDYAIVFDKSGIRRGMYDATSQNESGKLREKLLECLAEETPQDLTFTNSEKKKSS
jgi:cytochrome oxidase Cu insertion factor (SCO1/SenC/PrrC family)